MTGNAFHRNRPNRSGRCAASGGTDTLCRTPDHGVGFRQLSEVDAAALLPSLNSEMVARVLGRTRYSQGEEQEAELLATMIAQRVDGGDRPHADPQVQALRRRLRSTLG